MTLIEASLRINKSKHTEKDFVSLYETLEKTKEVFEENKMIEGIADSYYLQALLLSKKESGSNAQAHHLGKFKCRALE